MAKYMKVQINFRLQKKRWDGILHYFLIRLNQSWDISILTWEISIRYKGVLAKDSQSKSVESSSYWKPCGMIFLEYFPIFVRLVGKQDKTEAKKNKNCRIYWKDFTVTLVTLVIQHLKCMRKVAFCEFLIGLLLIQCNDRIK